jgi:DNA repair exonuclease SbcCD ATPase subunit
VEEPDRQEPNGNRPPDEPVEGPLGRDEEDTAEVEVGRGEGPELEELRAKLGIKDNRIRELYEEITASRLAADEARASREAGEGHIEALERERARLRERIRDLEEELRGRRRRREGLERQIARLERELARKDGEISRRDYLLERRADELEAARRETEGVSSRKDEALRDAVRRVEGLERDLEEREGEISRLQSTVDSLRDELESERELHRRLADPANRLRAGIDIFNESEGRDAMNALSRTLGRPEVHVALDEGEEPPALLTFTWQGVTWQTYAADPGPAVEEPRVYLKSAGEDLSGVDREPPNARVGPGGRVVLGL